MDFSPGFLKGRAKAHKQYQNLKSDFQKAARVWHERSVAGARYRPTRRALNFIYNQLSYPQKEFFLTFLSRLPEHGYQPLQAGHPTPIEALDGSEYEKSSRPIIPEENNSCRNKL